MTKLRTHAALATMAVALFTHLPSHAVLTAGDVLGGSLPSLVKDTYTGLQWLTPYATRSHAYNDGFVQALEGQYGLRYATATEAQYLINSNFGNPTTIFPGNTAGHASAQAFFGVFGVNESFGCSPTGQYSVPCPRTQGLTSTQGSSLGTRSAFGMIQAGSSGNMLAGISQNETSAIQQLGSWLIRETAVATSPINMLGDRLTFERSYPTVGTPFAPSQERVVAAGPYDEVLYASSATSAPFTRINADANQITFEAAALSGYGGTSTIFDGYRFSGFSHDISSVTLQNNTTGQSLDLAYDLHSISVNMGTGYLAAGSGFTLDVQFAAVSPVPEPDAGWMAASALLVLVAGGWKRRAKAA
jgi:hypothetical protein